jgi:hypothetical protein
MILKIFLPKQFSENIGVFTQTIASFCKILIITLVFEKNPIFCRKLAKIAEISDHNIDPWSRFYESVFGWNSSTKHFFTSTKHNRGQINWCLIGTMKFEDVVKFVG